MQSSRGEKAAVLGAERPPYLYTLDTCSAPISIHNALRGDYYNYNS